MEDFGQRGNPENHYFLTGEPATALCKNMDEQIVLNIENSLGGDYWRKILDEADQ